MLKGWGDWLAGPASLALFVGLLYVFFGLGPSWGPGRPLPVWWAAVVFLGGGLGLVALGFAVAFARGRWRRRRLRRQEFKG